MQPVIEALPRVLVDSSVRAAILAAAVALTLFTLRVANRNLHYRTWTAVLLAMLVMPVLHAALPGMAVRLPAWMAASTASPVPATPVTRPTEPSRTGSPVAGAGPGAIGATPPPEQAAAAYRPRVDAPPEIPAPSTSGDATSPSVVALLVLVYGVGVAIGLARLLVGVRRIHRLIARSRPIESLGEVGVRVRESDRVSVPLAAGVLRPVILLPSDWRAWDRSTLASVLEHERTHVARHDYLIGLLAEANRCLYWFHPLAWWLRKKLPALAEEVCDDLVIAKLGDRATYARCLIAFASRVRLGRRTGAPLGVAMARSSQLETRVEAVLNTARPLAERLHWAVVIAFLAVLLPVTALVASVRADSGEETPEPTPGEAPATQTEPVAEEQSPTDLLSKTVRVVASNGKPVVGATVTPWAIGSAVGHGLWTTKGLGESEPPVLTTDERGVVVIPYPRYAVSQERVPCDQLTCRVEHPDYVETAHNNVFVSGDQAERVSVVRVHPGALIEAEVTYEGKTLPAASLHAQVGDVSGGKLTIDDAGRMLLPRVAPGTSLIRLVSLAEDGGVLFSPVEKVTLADGESIKLRFEMTPGLTVKGALDASVPRPIKRGRVASEVIDVVARDESESRVSDAHVGHRLTMTWGACAPINEDGTFVLENLPAGELQVIALCDGHRAAAPTKIPDFATSNAEQIMPGRPQVFPIDPKKQRIEVAMTPTARCKIKVVGADNQPLANAQCGAWPNVFWWAGGSQVYCETRFSSADYLRDPELLKRSLTDRPDLPYFAETDANGVAVLTGLPEGQNIFAITHDDYELPLKRSDDDTTRYRSLQLTAGETKEFEFAMQPKGTDFLGEQQERPISLHWAPGPEHGVQSPKPRSPKSFVTYAADTELAGVVVDEQGEPLSGVTVDAWSWYPGNETTTNEEGRFALKGFERKQEVEVLFSKEGYSPSYFVSQKAGTDDWTVVLTQGTWLEGRVLDANEKPVPDATVKASRGPYRQGGTVYDEVTTQTVADAEGAYRLHVEPDTYVVQTRVSGVGAARYEGVEVGPKEKKKLDVRLNTGVTLRATVRNSVTGEPVEGFTLWNWRQPEVEGVSDAEGLLEIAGLAEGEFEFSVTAVGEDRRRSSVAGDYARWWSPDAADEFSRIETHTGKRFHRNLDELKFDLTGEVFAVDIFVEPAVTIRGRVLDPNGDPVAGATVAPAKTGSGNSITGDTRYSYETDDGGRFVMKLPASKRSEYNLVAHDGKYGEWRRWANGVGEPIQTEPGQEIDGVELRLTKPATVRGTVTDPLGEPRAHVKVRAAVFDRLDSRYYVPETETDVDGGYELKFLRPGKHSVQVGPYSYDIGQAPAGVSQIVEVRANEIVEGVNFATD